MTAPLTGFLQALRGAGVRISVAETIDAYGTVDLLGYADRTALKDALGLVLAKTVPEKALYEAAFERFFSRDAMTIAGAAEIPELAPAESAEAAAAAPLERMLLDGDQAGLALAMEQAAQAAEVSGIRFFTQTNIYARRILEGMGLDALERRIRDLQASGGAGGQARAAALAAGREQLGEAVRGYMARQLAVFADGPMQRLRDEYLQTMRLGNLDRRDLARLRVIVRALAKRLATRHARIQRHARRGHLDARHMLRQNMRNDGLLFRTAWKKRKIERPKIVAICDVSGSVAAVAEFLLLLLYSLADVLSGVRSFAFSSELMEVTDLLERLPPEQASAAILKEAGFGSTNYGRMLRQFRDGWMHMLDKRTTVIIMGDGRGNYTQAEPQILRQMQDRSRQLIWLNPEHRSSWGTGDSDMPRYLPHCNRAMVCNTVKHLESMVSELLKTARRHA